MAALLRLLGQATWLVMVVAGGCAAVFAVLSAAPGSADDVAGAEGLALGFGPWLKGVLQGDLGVSVTYRVGAPVAELIGQAGWESVKIVGMALVLTMVGAVVLTWLWQGRSHPSIGTASRVFAYALSASPAFLLAYWLTNVTNVSVATATSSGWIARPDWFPVPDSGDIRYFYSALTLAVGSGMLIEAARGLSAEVERIMDSEFVLFARASGRPMWLHMGPSLVGPITTAMVNRLTALFGGAVVIETVFNIGGLGRLTWEAALRRDSAVLLGTSLVWAVAYAVCRLGSEAIAVMVDPRRRTASAQEA